MLFGVRFELIISDCSLSSLKSIEFTNCYTYTLDMFDNLKCKQEIEKKENLYPNNDWYSSRASAAEV